MSARLGWMGGWVRLLRMATAEVVAARPVRARMIKL